MRRTIQMKKFSKQKALVIVIGLIALTGFQTLAQDCADYFTIKEGTVLSYVNYNPKGKVSGSNEMTFKQKTETPEGMKALFSTKLKDDKGEILHEGEFEIECKNGVLHFDAGQLLDPATMSAYESMEVSVTGDNLELPYHSADGTSIKDGGVKAVVSSGGMKIITLTVEVTNRKIEVHETIVTPAGTFKCLKYTYDTFTQAGFVKVNASGIEWYSQEVGTIRSESYDKNGKLTGYTVLESFSD